MPGNDTIYASCRVYLQSAWQELNLAANQTDKKMIVCGCKNIRKQELPQGCSPVTMIVQLSDAITAGSLTIDLVVNGAKVNKNIVMNSASGKQGRMNIKPGKVVANKGDDIAIWYSTSVDFAPVATIELWASVAIESVG